MNPDPIYRLRLTALQQHLNTGVPFLKWKFSEVAQWDATDTILVCGCAIAEASCLFRGENADLYRLVGAVGSHPGRPLGEQRSWTKGTWTQMQEAVQQWFGLDKAEFNFLFVPIVDDDDTGSWFTEYATASDIADGIGYLLAGNELPTRSEEEINDILDSIIDVSNRL